MTGTGFPVATDSRAPSWFGLRNIQVNGNRDNNNTGRVCCFYGTYTIIDHVVIGWGVSGGLYTEYATNVTSNASVADQEEGFVRGTTSAKFSTTNVTARPLIAPFCIVSRET
ncbi:hypothetical protein D3C85_1054500 [compost metagenome]